jgi:OmpA-OmpF porin, OOP family
MTQMCKSKLLIAVLGMFATGIAFAGGTVAPAPAEAPAAPAPEVVSPPPAPVVVAPVWAPHFYVGASIGRTRYSDTGGGSDNATGGKIFAGYQFHPNFAVEAAYVDLGSVDGAIRSVKGQGGVIDAVGILPFGAWGHDFNVFGKIGVADMKLNGGVDEGYKAGAHYGIGIGYNFTHALGVRLEAERFQKVGAEQVGFVPGTGTVNFGQARANLYSIGLQYNF